MHSPIIQPATEYAFSGTLHTSTVNLDIIKAKAIKTRILTAAAFKCPVKGMATTSEFFRIWEDQIMNNVKYSLAKMKATIAPTMRAHGGTL